MAVMFCDTNCELWFDKARELDLKVIKMPYTIGGKEFYYDLGEKTDFKNFYDEMRSGKTPSTSALNADNYKEYFEPYFKAGEDVLYVSFSDKLSATFTFMDQAVAELKEKYPKIKFVRFDTRAISLPAGMQVYLAKKYMDGGHTIDETVEYLKDLTKHIAVEFVVDDLKYLKRGGRISGLQAAVGTLLNFKPILKLSDDGKIVNTTKVNGRTKAITHIVEGIKAKGTDLDKYPIAIIHADCEADALKLKERLTAELNNQNLDIWIQPIGPVIGTHCGPGTLALVYHGTGR
ncbi:MAG: DegV family protein [Clostridiales bacterium]|jgi:DegV family protein with EDD domain|nr:DegV family protein [Clostridiales bacterium]